MRTSIESSQGNRLQFAHEMFIEKESDVLALIDPFSNLPKLNRKRTHVFVSQCYTTRESDHAFKQGITSPCR